ncbi:MAG TPA: zinc ribbon domain-containing protein [Gemmatimonadales bacterium]|nr:zinc ribbon domain-containing protein [Gemmatimonadales bacterium]
MNLDRLFRQIVLNLATKDPGGLRRALSLAEVRDGVVPYRANRRALGIETSEDYEMALLRLYAGEAGLARTAPAEARAELAGELSRPHPDLAILQQHETTTIRLDPAAVERILDPEPNLRFAPRNAAIAPEPSAPRKRSRSKPEIRPADPAISCCTRCSAPLPSGRAVKFCPQCGQNLAVRHCPECDTELEVTWKHCINCGVSVLPIRRTGSDR